MHYFEAKEHTPGRLHTLFADPYCAFKNDTDERQLHIRIMLHTLLALPMHHARATLRVIHGWENGGFEPSDLKHKDFPLASLDDFHRVVNEVSSNPQEHETSLSASTPLLSAPLASVFASAEADGIIVSDTQRSTPARWPALKGGLAIYTLFKMYHRLVYGEDDNYRCSQCETPDGLRELHEFHLEEGEFALLVPHIVPHNSKTPTAAPTILVMHASQLGPIGQLLKRSLPLFQDT